MDQVTPEVELSIIIPTLNGLHWLRDSIPVFLEQDWEGSYEILLVDSGSIDGTHEWIARYPQVRWIEVDGKGFRHGKTRNEALAWARGSLLLFTVQDACPPDVRWLKGMVEQLESSGADALCGGQAVPRRWDMNPWEWQLDSDLNRPIEVFRGDSFVDWSLAEQIRASKWDNVNALYRREALEGIPFPDVLFGEDVGWAHQALLNGKNLAYGFQYPLWHYHHQNRKFIWDRTWAAGMLWDREWGKEGIHNWSSLLDTQASSSRAREKRKLILRNLTLLGLLRLPSWIGYNWRLKRQRRSAIRAFLAGREGMGILDRDLYEQQRKVVPQAPLPNKL
jgi:rhamnosyltransferase